LQHENVMMKSPVGTMQSVLVRRGNINLSGIHKMTMTSFAVTLYGQCCRLHVVGQQVVRDISTVRICSPCFESNNTNLLLRLLIWCKLTWSWNVYFASNANHSW